MILKDIEIRENHVELIGNKAYQLFKLRNLGIRVPKFMVFISQSNEEIEVEIKKYFDQDENLILRSSANVEDSHDASYAGLFLSLINPAREKINESIELMLKQAKELQNSEYHKKGEIKLSIIIQECIDADFSGVYFSENPVKTEKNQSLMLLQEGLGEELMNGKANASTIIFTEGEIQKEWHQQEFKLVLNQEESGTKKVKIDSIVYLSDDLIINLFKQIQKIENDFSEKLDIEFCIKNNEIYFLQARQITRVFAEEKSPYILWDNSNIVESYPGISLPLTFSFIRGVYDKAYQNLAYFLGVSSERILANKNVFQNTLGYINHRIYYNLQSWYFMIALLPAYNLNARYMENMMGVKERFDLPKDINLSKPKAIFDLVKVLVVLIFRLIFLKNTINKFYQYTHKIFNNYNKINLSSKNSIELIELFHDFEDQLLNKWQAPLLNDLFAMIFWGSLKNMCVKISGDSESTLHNRLLCGSRDVISTEPILLTREMVEIVFKNDELLKLFENETDSKKILQRINNNKNAYSDFYQLFISYVEKFGDRCIGELKLENHSYKDHPNLLIGIIRKQVLSSFDRKAQNPDLDLEIRLDAEKEINQLLKGKWFKRVIFNWILAKARLTVSNRENLRFERTKAFGIVRRVFNQIGQNFRKQNSINEASDIHYLSIQEISDYIKGTSYQNQLKDLVQLRKSQVNASKLLLNKTQERFYTNGIVYECSPQFKDFVYSSELKGIGCCPGIVIGEALVVDNPSQVSTAKGQVLVALSTDPGWVPLYSTCTAIVVQRGSLLSHSAIVARELGIPCIVGVENLMDTVKNGDRLQIDGNTGKVIIL